MRQTDIAPIPVDSQAPVDSPVNWFAPLLPCRSHFALPLAILAQICIYGVILWLSPAFEFYANERDRPIALVFCLLILNFGLYLWCLFYLLKVPRGRSLFATVMGVSVLLRGIMLFSTPIQEVDIYRYMWDGLVSSQGITPFRYAPLGILDEGATRANEKIKRLQKLVDSNPGMRETISRVHFPELSTVYPPTSQLVFALATSLTPPEAAIEIRVWVMKSVILLFDVGVIVLLWHLLQLKGMHPAWTVSYAWAPLIIKEFANSGHLDAIAVFFTMAAIVLIHYPGKSPNTNRVALSGVMAGLAAGAKLYPIILFPLLSIYMLRRYGLQRTAIWCSCAIVVTAATLAPMLTVQPRPLSTETSRPSQPAEASRPRRSAYPAVPVPISLSGESGGAWNASGGKSLSSTPQQGLTTFLTRWEMNDLIFMVLEENLRPDHSIAGQPPLWFVVVPNQSRIAMLTAVYELTELDPDRIPFLLARAATAALLSGLLIWLCMMVWRQPPRLLEASFLCVAWFWMLAPTQNPWYWSWALCLIPFARSRVWLLVSGLALIYYLRFWFIYHAPHEPILGTPYRGVAFFDFVVTWIEFGPLLLALLLIPWCKSRILRKF